MRELLRKQGWFLNGQMPTGEQTQIEWNDRKFTATVWKFTFWKGLKDDCLVVQDTSERGAWEQLKNYVYKGECV